MEKPKNINEVYEIVYGDIYVPATSEELEAVASELERDARAEFALKNSYRAEDLTVMASQLRQEGQRRSEAQPVGDIRQFRRADLVIDSALDQLAA